VLTANVPESASGDLVRGLHLLWKGQSGVLGAGVAEVRPLNLLNGNRPRTVANLFLVFARRGGPTLRAVAEFAIKTEMDRKTRSLKAQVLRDTKSPEVNVVDA
jgi:hypothetical protein